MERHSRDGYFIVGEGEVGTTEPRFESFSLEATELRAFRFSRLGPVGPQLGEPLRRKLALAMTRDAGKPNSNVPAGYTYLGQFIDHDLTFDRSKLLDNASASIADLVQGRSPSLDLDCLYGLGPKKTRNFYRDGIRLKTGRTVGVPFASGPARVAHTGFDLARRADKTAIIPDPRNDENLIVGQTHLAMIRFHNRVVDRLAGQGVPKGQLFERARDLVVRHYQWMIRTDFMPRLVRPATVNDVFVNGRKAFEVGAPPTSAPTMPVEFSVAAYRMGHSMIRPAYDWNVIFDDGAGTLDLLFEFSGTSGDMLGDTRLPSTWIADLRRLYDFREAGRPDLRPIVRGRSRLNFARRIDTLLADPLRLLPLKALGGSEPRAIRRNLAFRNLTRARMLRLATGPQMARFLRSRGAAITPLTPGRIVNGNRGAKIQGLNPAQRRALVRDTPLWFYVLREAEFNNGKLAGVGARIVAETLHRAMEGSDISIVREPAWRPTLGPDPNTFRMVDLLLFAFEGKAALLNPLGS
jgi:Animal haem peroxidase